MENLKKVRITIERIELSADIYFKILRCIKKHEPEIWKEIKEVLIEDMEGAAANICTSGNSLHKHFVSGSASDFYTDLMKLINAYCKEGLKKPDLVHKMEYATESCKLS